MISIAMATYNGEEYIREQMDSILAQTVQDFEVIVCDDCSSDATRQILEEYQKKDSRIRFYANEANLGFKRNFEKAIGLCTGEFVALSDQDDIWLPNHLEKLVALIEDADLACGNASLIDREGRAMNILLNEVDNFYVMDSDTILYKLLCNCNPFQGASMLLRSSFLQKNVLPVPDKVLYHDAWFAVCACLRGGIRYTFDVISLYRRHGINVTTRPMKKWKLSDGFSRLFKILSAKEEYSTDRFAYIEELKKRIALTERQKGILDKSFIYHKCKCNAVGGGQKIKCLFWYWKNYRYIMAQPTNKYRFLRTVAFLVFNR